MPSSVNDRSLITTLLVAAMVIGCERSSSQPDAVGAVKDAPPKASGTAPSPAVEEKSAPETVKPIVPASVPKGQGFIPSPVLDSPPVEFEALAVSILGRQSDRFSDHAFKGLPLGATREQVHKHSAIKVVLSDTGWHLLENGYEVYFSEDQLVCIGSKVSDHTDEIAVQQVKDLFGDAEKDNIAQTTIVSLSGNNREESVRVLYHFPKTVVLVRFVNSVSRGINDFKRNDRTFVAIYDRDWVLTQLQKEYNARSEGTRWFVNLVNDPTSETLDPAKLPKWDSRVGETGFSKKGIYWFPAKPRMDSKKPKGAEKFNIPIDWVAAGVKTPGISRNIVETMSYTFRFGKTTEYQDNPLERTTLRHLISKTQSVMLQTYFLPQDGRITLITKDANDSYEWQTEGGLKVSVHSDHSVVAKRPVK